MSLVCLIIAAVLFFLGAFSRWWDAPNQYHPSLISAGLFFATLSVLWPQIGR